MWLTPPFTHTHTHPSYPSSPLIALIPHSHRPQEAVNFVRSLLLDDAGIELDSVCSRLVTAATDRGSSDNVSVIVVALNQV